ncbi:hypothetical protein KGF57_001453 [Candida theae]|uniref:BBC1/AIM3 cysteine proteinase-fold domain-containing protein n=1 Tax=Candida theae TaxID=1198502 RepID=A0AAD5BGY4_9ASCO|nr:uncharacterized protein KGF57_001453 [Candida theae]KAI5962719.1 hypothetical protein KGF57_001453 [Candida theae]
MSSDQFKAVGIATAKGIGRGTKALGKAGYTAYKKNDAKRKGVEYVEPPSKGDRSSSTSTSAAATVTNAEIEHPSPYVFKPLPTKEALSSYQQPPKRNVGAYAPSERKYVTPQGTQNTAQTQQLQQSQQHQQPQQYQQSQQYQQYPPQYSPHAQPLQQAANYPVEQVNQPPPPPRPGQSTPIAQTQPASVNAQPPQAQPTPFAQVNSQVVSNQQQLQSNVVQPTYPQQYHSTQPGYVPPQSQPQPQVQGEAPPPAYTQHNQTQQYQEPSIQYASQAQPSLPQRSQVQTQPVPPTLPSRTSTVSGTHVQPQVTQPLSSQSQTSPDIPSRGSTLQTQQVVQHVVGNDAAAQVSENQSLAQPIASNDINQVETEKPKRPLPDPKSFAPPPMRRVQSPDATGASHKNVSHAKPLSQYGHSSVHSNEFVATSPTNTEQGECQPDTTSQPPALPSRTSANSVSSSTPSKKPFDLSAFPPPPQIPKPKFDGDKEKRTFVASRNGDSADEVPPPMPSRPSQSTPSASSISDSISEAKEAIQKKKAPPKPVKKPKALSSGLDTSNQGVQSELENMFQKMNVKKSTSGVEVEQNEPPIPKPKSSKQVSPPPIKPKPVVKPKPEVKPKPGVTAARVNSPTPPPTPKPRNYKRAAAPTPTVNAQGPPDLDLELTTQWFTNTNSLVLPRSILGLNYQTNYSYTTSGGSQIWTRIITVRLKDLSIVSYKFVWNASDAASVTVSIDRFVPSPLLTIPSKQELVANHERFGEYVASWCEHHKGQQVGSGECWDLAKFALEKGCGKHAFVSQYYTHGYPILQIKNSGAGIEFINSQQQLDVIRRGDILQFKACTFFNPITGVTQTVGAPDHTSVVVENDGSKLKVVEQNVNNIRRVVEGEYILKNLTAGEVYVYRPMPSDWAGSL